MAMLPKKRFLNDALQYAVQTNNIKRVEMLLNQGVNISWECRVSGRSPLQIALELEHIKIFKLLLDHGANTEDLISWLFGTNARERPTGFKKVLQANPEVLEDIFVHGVEKIKNAVAVESCIFVDSLSDVGSDSTVDVEELYRILIKQGNTIWPVKDDTEVKHEGHMFIKPENLDFRLVLLYNAIDAQSVSCVKLLIEEGVPVNILTAYGTVVKEKCGCVYKTLQTPLHYACRYNCVEIVKLLLQNGAKYVSCEDVLTPLDVAFKSFSTDVVSMFVDNGYVSNSTKSKLHLACLLEEVEDVREMLDDETDVNKLDMFGRSPLVLAIYVKNMTLFKLLEEAGAALNPPCNKFLCDDEHCSSNKPVTRAVEYTNAEALDYMLDKICGKKTFAKCFPDTGLLTLRAVVNGDFETFNVLMKRGANFTTKAHGIAPIHAAAIKGNLPMLEALTEKGVCVNDNAAINKHVHIARRSGRRCIKKICQIESAEKDMRPLYLCEDSACIRFLLDQGADIHSVGCKDALYEHFENLGNPFECLPAGEHAAMLNTQRDQLGPVLDYIPSMEPCPPYVKVVETGSVAAMKAYFSSKGEKLCKTDLVFQNACMVGKFELVRYLLSQNPAWLNSLFSIIPMFIRPRPEVLFLQSLIGLDDGVGKTLGGLKSDEVSHLKMMGMLLDLGCTFNFNSASDLRDEDDHDHDDDGDNDDDDDEDDWLDDSYEGDDDDEEIAEADKPMHKVIASLAVTYESQRFVFAKLLQENCGRNLRIIIYDLLRALMLERDYDMILLLLVCGHEIDEDTLDELHYKAIFTPHQEQTDEFCDKVNDMKNEPLGLQNMCRIKIRSELFDKMKENCYINEQIKKLPLPKSIQNYLSFAEDHEFSYLMYESENTADGSSRHNQARQNDDSSDENNNMGCPMM